MQNASLVQGKKAEANHGENVEDLTLLKWHLILLSNVVIKIPFLAVFKHYVHFSIFFES